MLFTNHLHDNFAKDPAVIRFAGRYFLYHTFQYTDDRIGVGIAVSDDLENWEVAGELPLTQECEQKGIGAPAAILINGKLHLFYQSYGSGKLDAICHAVSDDGLHFEKDPGNPVFRPTADWCCGRAIDADVCLFGGKLWLYFATRDHDYRVQKLGAAYADPSSAFTRGDWTQAQRGTILCPELTWEGECIEAPAAIESQGKVYLFYGGAYNCKPQQIGCAVSSDGLHFERLFTEPFLPCGPRGAWNSSESGHPYVFRDDDGRVYLFYQGSSDMGKTWYLSRKEICFRDGLPHLL